MIRLLNVCMNWQALCLFENGFVLDLQTIFYFFEGVQEFRQCFGTSRILKQSNSPVHYEVTRARGCAMPIKGVANLTIQSETEVVAKSGFVSRAWKCLVLERGTVDLLKLALGEYFGLNIPNIKWLLFGCHPFSDQFFQGFIGFLCKDCLIFSPPQILREIVACPQRNNRQWSSTWIYHESAHFLHDPNDSSISPAHHHDHPLLHIHSGLQKTESCFPTDAHVEEIDMNG